MIQLNPNRKIENNFPDSSEKTATNSFTTLDGGLVSALNVAFTPIQDLHGQSKPWVGGVGKNLLPIDTDTIKTLNGGAGTWTDNKKTIEGVEVELLTDDDGNTIGIKVNRVSSSTQPVLLQLAFNNFTFLTNNVSYTLNGCPTGGSSSTYALVYQAKTGEIYWDEGSGKSFTFAGQVTNETLVRLVIRQSYTPVDMIFYPMIRLSTIADPTFEPYSNICPISGHTQVQSKINNTTYTTSLGDTYYGGEVDQVSGEGEVTFAEITDSDFNEIKGTSGGGLKYLQYGISQTPNMQILSNMLPTVSGTGWWETTPCVAYVDASGGGGTYWVVRIFVDVTDLTDFQSKYSDLQILYSLATPSTLSLTGQNITAEVGVNNVSAPLDNQEIVEDGVTYKEMFSWADVVAYVQSQVNP